MRQKSESGSDSNKEDTKAYTLDSGKKIDIPKNPERIAVVAPTYAGGIKYLGGKIVAVNEQVDNSHILKDKFKDVEKLEKMMLKKLQNKTRFDRSLLYR